jgi:hypothetical protein
MARHFKRNEGPLADKPKQDQVISPSAGFQHQPKPEVAQIYEVKIRSKIFNLSATHADSSRDG